MLQVYQAGRLLAGSRHGPGLWNKVKYAGLALAASPKLRREGLVHLWTWSLGGMACLLPLVTWGSQRDPEEAAMVAAQAEMQLLLPRLEQGIGQLEDQLFADRGNATWLYRSALDETGSLVQPPVGQVPHALDQEGLSSVAYGWYREGMQQLAQPQEALLTLEEAARLCPADGPGLALQVDLARAALLQELGRAMEAEDLLQAWVTKSEAVWTLGQRPVGLMLGYRLLEIYEGLDEGSAAAQMRASLRQKLLAGHWPLAEEEIRRELRFLAPQEGSSLSAKEEEALGRDLSYRRLLQSLPGSFLPGATVLEKQAVLMVDRQSRQVVVYPLVEVETQAMAALQSIMGERSSFALVSLRSEETPGLGPTTFLAGTSLGLPGWQIHLRDLGSFADPIRGEQRWMLLGVILLSFALLVLLVLGRRMFAREQLLQRTRNDFLAGVSHELRTPAASLAMLSANLLEERVTSEEKRQEYYRSMRRDARRLEMLVADVLDMSRMERGKFSIDLQLGDLGSVVKALVEEQSPRLRDAGIEVILEMEESLPEIMLDAFAVERACANLLENVRRYAVKGGQVAVRLKKNEASVALTVSDQGPGIPEAWRHRIFEPYERLPSTERLAAGAGLGLALVKAVMVAHGGEVTVSAGSGGQGACFRLEFPTDG